MPNPTQSASKATSRAAQSGVKTPSKQGSGQSSGAQSAMKRDLKSKDFAAGEEALKPKDGAPKEGGKAKPTVTSLDSKKAKKVAADLGKVQTISAANQAMGNFLGELVPNEGHSVEVDLDLKVFVQGIMIGMDLGCRVERTKHGVELSGNMGLIIGVGGAFGGGPGDGKAWAGLKGTMGFKSKADSGPECLDLIMFGVDRWLRNQQVTLVDAITSPVFSGMKALGKGEWMADAIFGDGFGEKVLKAMAPKSKGDEADTLESTYDIGIAGGLDGEVGAAAFGASFDVGASKRYESTTTLSKNDKGKLKRTEKGQTATDLSLSLSVGKLKLAGEGTFTQGDDGKLGCELSADVVIPTGMGTVTDIYQAIYGVYEKGMKQAGNKVGGASGAVLTKASTDGTREAALGVLEACGFIVPSLRFAFSMDGKGRTFAIEVVRTAEVDENIGAGSGGGIDAKLEMGTKLLDKSWNAS